MSHEITLMLIAHGPLYLIAIATLIKAWRTHEEVRNGLGERIIKGVGEEAKTVAEALAEMQRRSGR